MKYRRWVSIGIFTCVVCLLFLSAGMLVRNATKGETNFDLIEFVAESCTPLPMQRAERMAVLRIDDIQAFAWAAVSQAMIRDAHARNITPVLAIIPMHLEENPDMYSFLRSVRCKIEPAIHGWTSEENEFAALDAEAAEDRITKGKRVLDILTRRSVTTFIPPNNLLSDAAKKVLRDAEFIVSSGEIGAPYDFAATTFVFSTGEFVPATSVESTCAERWKTNPVCVIMMHPQDFTFADGTLDPDRYAEYLKILDDMQRDGVSFVSFGFLESMGSE